MRPESRDLPLHRWPSTGADEINEVALMLLAVVLFGTKVSGTLLALAGIASVAVVAAVWYIVWYLYRHRG
jgi:hypothetical protein